MLLLDDVDADEEDDDGFRDELEKVYFSKDKIRNINAMASITYETVLFTLNTLTVPSEHVDASLLP